MHLLYLCSLLYSHPIKKNMIFFFQSSREKIYALESKNPLSEENINKLNWLFGGAILLDKEEVNGGFIGPRKEMITPWSTNAVEITLNMGIQGILRIEEFTSKEESAEIDPMLQLFYSKLDQKIFHTAILPEQVISVTDIEAYSTSAGLALSSEEIHYLEGISKELDRPLTDSEVFGFSQVTSEHCRHKIFHGTFIIDGIETERALFQLM